MKNEILALVLLSVGAALNVSAGENKDSMYSQSSKGVVPIQELQSVCTPGLLQSNQQTVTLGTGFYVMLDEPGSLSTWLVTARHVVDAHADLLAKTRVGSETKGALYLVLPRTKWVFHPSPIVQGIRPIDVAVMKVLVPSDTLAFRYCPGECSVDPTLKQSFLNHLADAPEPTNHALFFGYPEEVVPGEIPPFVRSGIVAYGKSNPGIPYSGIPLADDSVFYIDAPAFGGNSGGPVMSEPGLFQPEIRLFGLVTGSNPTRNYTIVTSVTRIKETIDYAAQQKSISPQHGWTSTPPSFSHSCTEQPSQPSSPTP